ncbi:MAG: MFS transporter [Nostocoides sp.]
MPSARSVLPDLSPLRTSPAFARLFLGFTASNIGSQLAIVAIGLQVYGLTGSTGAVGLVGLFALVPTVILGLYGGALADHYDRRTVALVSSIVAWATSIAAAAQAWLHVDSVPLLYAIVAAWSGAFAVTSPARTSITPRLLPLNQLPAANALNVTAMNTAMTAGPLLAGFLVGSWGFPIAYTLDAILTIAALWGVLRLPSIPPEEPEPSAEVTGGAVAAPSRAGLRSVRDGLSFLRTAPNVRMTFVADIAAMVLAQPRVLFPAAGAVILGGGAATVGQMYAAVAIGGILAMLFSGRFGGVRRQGAAILLSITGWGFGIAGLGVVLLATPGYLDRHTALIIALVVLAAAGACDSVSSVFRSTILQAAAPDRMRGRLQGVFIVVVAGGPRLGEVFGGGVAEHLGEGWTAVLGGLACVAAMAWFAVRRRGFVHYDAAHPTP